MFSTCRSHLSHAYRFYLSVIKGEREREDERGNNSLMVPTLSIYLHKYERITDGFIVVIFYQIKFYR